MPRVLQGTIFHTTLKPSKHWTVNHAAADWMVIFISILEQFRGRSWKLFKAARCLAVHSSLKKPLQVLMKKGCVLHLLFPHHSPSSFFSFLTLTSSHNKVATAKSRKISQEIGSRMANIRHGTFLIFQQFPRWKRFKNLNCNDEILAQLGENLYHRSFSWQSTSPKHFTHPQPSCRHRELLALTRIVDSSHLQI